MSLMILTEVDCCLAEKQDEMRTQMYKQVPFVLELLIYYFAHFFIWKEILERGA